MVVKEVIKDMLYEDIELIEKLSENGDEDASFCLGYRRYMDGDYDEALELLMPFANGGEAEAQYYVGCCLCENDREDDAFRYFLLSSVQGNPDSAYMLVNYYRYGAEDLAKDEGEALLWLRAAADRGNALAAEELVKLVESGRWEDGEEFEGEMPADISTEHYRELAKKA